MEQLDMVERAEKVADRMEAANKRTEELIKMHEKIKVQQVLGGQAEAGVMPATDQEKLKAGMKNYFKGTAIEGALR